MHAQQVLMTLISCGATCTADRHASWLGGAPSTTLRAAESYSLTKHYAVVNTAAVRPLVSN